MVKAIKDLRRSKVTGDDNINKKLGDSGLKIMTVLVNKIYMSGDWPKEFLYYNYKTSREKLEPEPGSGSGKSGIRLKM